MCVDDDPITLMLCKKVITKASFGKEIVFAQNGQEAIDVIEDMKAKIKRSEKITSPTIIFLDLNMPILNGWDFLEYFTKQKSAEFDNTKVIILSSTIDPADFNKAKQYPSVSHFLSKPITVEMLENLKKSYH